MHILCHKKSILEKAFRGKNIMNRLEMIRSIVDDILRQQPDKEESRCGFVHL